MKRKKSIFRFVYIIIGTLVFSKALLGQIDFVNAHKDRRVTAVRIDSVIELDGEFNEPAWALAEPAKDFIQRMPETGAPATEPTEVRILYDHANIYIGAICFDSMGSAGIVLNDISRDFDSPETDGFRVIFDTFNDDRNGFYFYTNPAGAKGDLQTSNDGRSLNRDWDGIWHVKAKTTDKGWQVEIAIPFTTLRFNSEKNQEWGINFGRRLRRKYEDSYWAPLPPQFRSLSRVSLAGTLEGLEGVRQGRNLYLKPYISAPLLQRKDDDWDFQPDVGMDLKYGLTSQLTLDLTVNTDFSQVEVDEEQINLTRFSLFFPEKRDFFLENAGIFSWGRTETRIRRQSDAPDVMPFFSRRIGLTDGGEEALPILGGARLTGRAGAYTLGFLSMQTGDYKDFTSTNYSVVRVRRDLFKQSDFGGIFVNKQAGDGSFNRTFGLDANFTFLNYLDINTYYVKSQTPGVDDNDAAGNITVAWEDGFWDLEAGHLRIGENFSPEVGFVPRAGIHKSAGKFGITPRPGKRIPWIREFRPTIETSYITNEESLLETRLIAGRFTIDFSDSSRLTFGREMNFERLFEPFKIRKNVYLPEGDYTFSENSVSFETDQSRLLSLEGRISAGEFWNGDRDSYRTGIRITPSYKFSTALSWSHNNISLPDGEFQTELVAARLNYAFSTSMFLNALFQYNSDRKEVVSNVRFNLIHKPLSDFFIVYNERRGRDGEIEDRALVAKLTYVLAF